MTEHLKRRLENAAGEVRSTKKKIESADSMIGSHEQSIESSRASIEGAGVTIKSCEVAIENSKRAIQRITEERDRSCFEYQQAQRRLSFLTAEMTLHPHADL